MEDRVEDESDDRLSEFRIQQRATLRRSLYRSRSHAIVATIVCSVASIELARECVHFARAHAFTWLTIVAIALIAAIYGSVAGFRTAVKLDRQCKLHDATPELPEPDFSTLSDGSQQWKNLHDVR